MVTVIPKDKSWSEIGELFGGGVTKGWQDTSDQKAIQSAIQDLPENATPRQVLDKLTGIRTYNPEAKQAAIKSYQETADYQQKTQAASDKAERDKGKADETARHNKAIEDIQRGNKQNKINAKGEKNQAAEDKAKKSKTAADFIIDSSDVSPELKKSAKETLNTPQEANNWLTLMKKGTEPSEYDIAQNKAKRFDKTIESYKERAADAERLLPPTEVAIMNNERYELTDQAWDSIVDAINNPITNPYKTAKGQALEQYIPISISSFGAKMGGVLTNQKIGIISKKAVGLGKDKNVNRLFLYMDYYDRQLDVIRNKEANAILNENKYGLAPGDFQEQLDKRMKPIQEQIGRDLDRLVNNKKPVEEISITNADRALGAELEEGEIGFWDPQGNFVGLPEEEAGNPEYAKWTRISR